MKNFTFFRVFLLLLTISLAAMAQSPWILQRASGLPNSVNPSVVFSAVDENICWGINTNNSQYLRTTDGGTNWTVSTITGATGLKGGGISAIDANTAYVAMNSNTNDGIYKTTDGGLTWVKQGSAFSGSGGFPNVVHFFNANNGVCAGDPRGGYWEIYTTTDGGANWSRVPSGNIPPPLSGESGISGNEAKVVVGNSFWFSTWAGSLYRTTDRGITWTVARNIIGNAFDFAFKDSLNGLACTFINSGNELHLSRTSDGGATWTPILPVPSGLSGLTTYYIAYAKGTIGSYVITSNNNIGGPVQAFPGSAYSNDDGATWTKNSSLPLGPATFASDKIGWSGGVNDSVYKWDSNLLSTIPAAGLQLWLKADEGVILNGSTVSQWVDQSGNGNNALQSTTNRQPLFVNNALNDKPVLHFDGINDRLGLTGSTTMSQISIFLVFKIDSGLVGNEGTDPLPYYPIVLGNFDHIGKGYGLSMRNFFTANSPNLIGPFVGEESYVNAQAPNIAAYDQWKVLSVETNQTMWNTTVRSNGVDAVITPGGTTNTPLSVPLGTPEVSGLGEADNVPAGHLIFKGDISEVIVYDTVLSESERLAVEQYLHNKYNITITDVADNQNGSLPEEFILNQNYPNPFNPSTKINYQIPATGIVSLKVYDVLGKEVATLVNEEKPVGSYEVNFNASQLSSGIYFFKLQAGSFVETKKMILIK